MKEFLNSPAGSWVKVFLSAILGFILNNLSKGGSILDVDWQALLSAGVAAVLPVIINWLNPADTRYGKVD